MNPGMMSSKTAEWATPWELFHELNRDFGPIVLDVCATSENAKCDRYLDAEVGGLVAGWAAHLAGNGACWMNPPYGREIGLWVAKAEQEARNGATVVCLLPARTDTRWWHDHIWDAENHEPRVGVIVRFLRGRVRFIRADGTTGPAPFPSAVVVFTPDVGDLP